MRHLIAITALLMLAAAVPLSAGVIYSNGAPTISTIPDYAYAISGTIPDSTTPYWVSDTFTLPTTTYFNEVEVALWFPIEGVVSSLNYCISASAACGTPLISGTGVTLTGDPSTIVNLPAVGYTLEEFTFYLGNQTLNAGTYWLQLWGAQSTVSSVYWNDNNGSGCLGNDGLGGGCPSGAMTSVSETPLAYQGNKTGNNSESFDMESIPEPGSMILLGSGLLALAGMRRRMRAR